MATEPTSPMELLRRLVMDYGDRCDDHATCSCSMAQAARMVKSVCGIGGVDDGTLRVCCSTHEHVLCAHHYAVTHFVETAPEFDPKRACNALRSV